MEVDEVASGAKNIVWLNFLLLMPQKFALKAFIVTLI